MTSKARLNGGALGLVRDALASLERKTSRSVEEDRRLISLRALFGDMEKVLLKEARGEKLTLSEVNDIHSRAQTLLSGG